MSPQKTEVPAHLFDGEPDFSAENLWVVWSAYRPDVTVTLDRCSTKERWALLSDEELANALKDLILKVSENDELNSSQILDMIEVMAYIEIKASLYGLVWLFNRKPRLIRKISSYCYHNVGTPSCNVMWQRFQQLARNFHVQGLLPVTR